MNIRKKKKRASIKRFTFGAATTAMLALNANTASATTCPALITGTDLAATVCSFDSGTSVTVANNASLGGILMNGTSGSKITINTGGTINGTTSALGIQLTSASLTNGITNNGTISVSNTAININNSTVGDIKNTGTIEAQNSAIIITGGSTVHNISNSGTIVAGGVDESILVSNSTANGNITNSGKIDGGSGNGILLQQSTVNGDIKNSGIIAADGSTGSAGISIRNVTTIAGTLTNKGTISAGGTGILLRSASQIEGGISNSGTIRSEGTGIFISTGTINQGISNSGTINGGTSGISINATSTINGGISNSGTIHGGSVGLYINSSSVDSISNTGDINGGTTGIFASDLRTANTLSNSGTIKGDTNAIVLSSPGLSSDIDILGKHARIIGAVQATDSTVNITNGADFTSEGTYNVNNFTIASNAVFTMANAITVGSTFYNSGTLRVHSSQTLTGNYLQNTGGVFQIDANSTTNYGQLSVTGNADLSESGNINVQIAQNALFHTGDVLSNIITGSTFTVPTEGFNVTSNSYLWHFIAALNNTNDAVNLTLAINSAAYNACNGRYCQGAANAIINQVSTGNTVFSPFATLSTEAEFQTAASQSTAVLTNANAPALQFLTNSVIDVIPTGSTFTGESGGDAMLYEPGKMWVKPYGGLASQNQTSTLAGYNAKIYGVVVGRDITPSQDWLLGGAIAAGGDNLEGASQINEQSVNSGTYQGILYAVKTFKHDIYLAEQGLIGYGDNNTSRTISVDNSTAEGQYNSWFTNLRAELGRHFTFHHNFVFTPEVDASYLFVNQTAYQESNSPLALSISSSNISSLVLGAYANTAYHFISLKNLWDTALTSYVGLADNVLSNNPQNTAVFIAGGPSFTTGGAQYNQLVFRGGVGLAVTNPAKPLSLTLNYDLQSGSNIFNEVGSITLSYKLNV